MNRFLTILTALAALSATASADPKAQLTNVAANSYSATGATSADGLKSGGAYAFGETKGAPAPVRADIPSQYAASRPNILNAEPRKDSLETKEPPPPGFLAKAGSTLKEYTPHLLTAGIAGAAGAVVAKVAGFGMLGGIAAGAGIGLAAMYLYKKGETGAAIGAASFGLAGLALGGPIGGLAGAVVGGLGAWLLGKFFA